MELDDYIRVMLELIYKGATPIQLKNVRRFHDEFWEFFELIEDKLSRKEAAAVKEALK